MSGWLSRYLAYTEENEAPQLYHYFSGITVLAHILGRKVWVDRGFWVTYPGQMITILVGPSGARKSTSINLASSFLSELGDVNIIANKLSAQSLIDCLNRGMVTNGNGISKPADSTGFAAASELSVFMPKQGYAEEIVPVITDIFDAKAGIWRHRTRGAGTVELSNPLLTILSGSTPDWLQTNIPINAYGGGFMARMFLVWNDKKSKLIPRPEKNTKLARVYKELLAEFLILKGRLIGAVTWTSEGEKWFDDFYYDWASRDESGMNPFEAGYHNRRPEHMLRVAICLSAAQKHELILDELILQAAHESLSLIEKDMKKCLESPGAPQAFSANFALVLKKLEAGPLTKRELQRQLWRHLSVSDLSMALQTFVDAGLIEQKPKGASFEYALIVQ